MHLPPLYVHVSLPLTELETPFYNFRLLGLFETDERVLGRRTYGHVPRGRNNRDARRFKCDICGSSTFLGGALISILEIFRSHRARSSLQRKLSSDRSHPKCCEGLSAGMTNTASACWRKSPFSLPGMGGPCYRATGTIPRMGPRKHMLEKLGSERLLYVVSSHACSDGLLPMRS